MSRSKDLAARAQALIPAGCHTYSKGDDQFPANAPGFIDRALGCRAWDVDGREFIDWGMGLRSVVLGHGYEPVLDAVRAQLGRGSNFTRPSPLEVELAEALVELIPSAEMVKFGKNGSDVTSAAVRLARAYTGRDLVARCRDHPFFSVDDWFIGSTECSAGVPLATQALTHQFGYNDLPELEALFAAHPGRIAAVVMEPATTDAPADDFLARVRALATRHGAVLVFDEMITGFRWHLRGAQAYFGVTPDLSTFGKALGNGFSVSALCGRRDIMRLGGLDHERERVFLLSATHGGETHALAAAIAMIREVRRHDVVAHLWTIGARLQAGLGEASREHGLGALVTAEGYPCSPVIVCRDGAGQPSLAYRTLFLQEMVARGVLIPYVAPSYAHGEREVEQTVAAAREAFRVYARAIDAGGVEGFLEGPAVKPVFRRFN